MRKRYYLVLMLIALVIIGYVYNRSLLETNLSMDFREKIPRVAVTARETVNWVQLWQDDGKDYVFLPSCVNTDKIKVILPSNMIVRINGQLIKNGGSFEWQKDRLYEITVQETEKEEIVYHVQFLKSENIPSAFINTQTGNMEYLLADKQNEEKGDMCIVNSDGSVNYQGELSRISGRGNSTWTRYDKKPYAIKLPTSASLCGLRSGEKWNLLALFREGSKLNNKFAMDMAEQLELQYTPQGEWIDLYLNGEYAGIYLLTEAIVVGEGRVNIYDLDEDNLSYNQIIGDTEHYEEDSSKGYLIANGKNITGGYLIERDAEGYYEAESCGFITSTGNHFSVKAPKYASSEEIEYIQNYVECIEQEILNNDSRLWEHLDRDSFAKRMLIDEIAMDYDACMTSMFFYKERDNDLLYSGPIWDYDIAFGGVNSDDAEGKYVDYNGTILDNAEYRNTLEWYEILSENTELKKALKEKYSSLEPFCREMLEYGLDEYAEYIRESVAMDAVRWREKRDSAGWYEDYDANIKYMKFFIAKRMNCIGKRLGVTFAKFEVPKEDEQHRITFVLDGKIVKELTVADGTELKREQLPDYDKEEYEGWRYEWGKERFREEIPVYDDMILYNERLQEDS